MIKNRITQIVYRTVFLTISVFGIIDSFGLFAGQEFGFDCLVYYTSLSNFLCFGIMLMVLLNTLKHVKKGELEGANDYCLKLKFYATIAITVTFLVYNILLTEDGMFEKGWNNLGNMTKHIICPLLFVIDYFLFDKRYTLKWYDALLCTILPLIYVVFILIRGAILPANFDGTIYPYFFLNAAEIGYMGVFKWVLILVVLFIVLAFIFVLYNITQIKDKKIKVYLNGKN